jgi:large subunit ribosomal protein L22
MEAKASALVTCASRRSKARRMVDLIRGKKATEAVTVLKLRPAGCEPCRCRKTLESAIANAQGEGRQGCGEAVPTRT